MNNIFKCRLRKVDFMNRRSYRRKRIKRNRKIRRVRFYFIMIFLVILSVFGFKFIEKNKGTNEASSMENLSKEEIKATENIQVAKKENKDLGDIESIIEYGDNGLIGVHYPIFKKDNIDKINKDLVSQYIEDFHKELEKNGSKDKDYRYELSIDYDTYKGPNNIVSINYNIVKNSSYLAHPDEVILSKVYDLNEDKEIKLDDFMTGQYLKHISDISEEYFIKDEKYKKGTDSPQFKEAINPSIENYSNFIIKEEKIVFLFPRYTLFSGNLGSASVEIAYSDLKDYINPSLLQDFTQIESSNNSAIDKDKVKPAIVIPKRDIDPNKPMIALTFDDGPNKKVTLPILDILKEYDSVGTFFILGNRVSGNEDVLRRTLEEGSEIGNHSYNHKQLTKLSDNELAGQIINTQDAVEDATGIKPRIMRPTYGAYNDNLKAKAGMPLILWSIDTLDWKSRNAKMVIDHVVENIKDGDIVLMHDIYESTGEAVKVLVPKLREMGYQLVTVSELIESGGQTLKDGQIYNQIYKK